MSEGFTDAPAEPPPSEEKETRPELKADSPAPKLDEIEKERDKLNQKAGGDDKLPVNEEGDKDKAAQEKDSRALIKERATAIRAQEKAAKEQKKAAEAQRGTAEQNELVEVTYGGGEAKGIMPKYKADADNLNYKKIKSNPWKRWVQNH